MPSISLAVSLRGQLLSGVRFQPSALFALGEQGVWFDPSDVANLNWRRNLLTWTEQFDNAAWNKSGVTISANADVAPDGTMTADLLTAGVLFRSYTTTLGSHVVSVYAKPSGGSSTMRLEAGSAFVPRGTTTFNLTSGTVSSGTGSITPVGGGWYRLSAVMVNTGSGDNNIYWDTFGSGALIWGAQAELGSVATDYQRISDVNTEVIERFPNATLYQDTAGTTPVTTTGQSVGLMLDKSKGLVLGSELVTTPNITGLPSGGGTRTYSTGASLVAGRYYWIEADVTGYSGTNVVGFSTSSGVLASILSRSENGKLRELRLAAGSGVLNMFTLDTNTANFSNISVKELPGNHAVQATTANRPIYGIHPVGGRRNLLVRTEEFENAAWTKVGATASANSTTAPIGDQTADTLTEDTSSGGHNILASFSKTASSQTYTTSLYVKPNGRSVVRLRLNDGSNTNNATVEFTLTGSGTAASATLSGTFTAGSGSVSALPDGWYRISVTATTGTETTVGMVLFLTSGGSGSYTGNGTSGVFLWGAQLETGSTATNYQRVTDQYNVTEAGVPSVSYLFFDGVNDSLATPTITPGTDKAQVFAGVRKLVDLTTQLTFQVIAETSVSSESNNGAFRLNGSVGFNTNRKYEYVQVGTLEGRAATTSASFAAPNTAVLSGLGNISGDLSTLRINGVQEAQSTADQGTGNFLAYPLYVGARNNASNFFNGHLYSLIARFGPNLAAGQISSTETWVAGKTGIAI